MNRIKALWSDSSSRKIILFFGVIVLLLVVLLFFQQNKMQEQTELKIQFIEQKNMLRDELDDLIDEHDELLEEYGDLNNQLQDKDSIIQNQITEIRNLIRTKNDLSEARKKIVALKNIAKRYLSNIDSLLVANENLTIEKDSIIKENININWKNYKLNKQNKRLAEKVSKGSVLELLDLNIETIRYRGTGREVSTRFARKVQKLRICFSIAANHISDAEEKIVFMQLIDANGDLIQAKENIKVNVSDSIFNCTISSVFNYQNIEMNNCFEWERVQQLERGNYLINLIIEGRVAGQKQLKLR
jgi:hypothetical protein